MDSHRFVQALHSIGYPKIERINPQDLEWAYDNSAVLPFLAWFTDSVGVDNVVSADDMQKFKGIKETGGIVSGHQLEEALESVKHEIPESDTLEFEVEKLRNSLEQARAKRQSLLTHCNKLSVQQVTLHDRMLKMKEVEDHSHHLLKQATDKCAMQDVKLNKALKSLASAVCSLSSLYKKTPEGKKQDHSEVHFLSQLDLSAFHDAENKYSHDLTVFTKKQFFEGVAQVLGEGQATQYSLLDIKSPQKGVVLDKHREESFLEDCEELQRLQNIFPRSECDRINAMINAKKAHSAVAEAAALLESLKCGHFPTSLAEINHFRKSLDKKVENAKSEARPLLTSLPGLMRELGSLQGGEILTGDYDLKLKRQAYFTKKQDQVITHLVGQRARTEFLSLLYELELRCHKDTHVLLSAIGQVLSQHLKAWQKRMEAMEDPDLTEKKFQGTVIDARDTSSLRLFQLLEESEADKGMLCVPKQRLVEKAKHLHAQHTCAKAADQTMDEKYTSKVSQLDSCVKKCEEHLYAGSSTTTGQPMLSSSDIQESIASLTTMLDTLQKDMTDIISDMDKKKATLKSNVLQSKERELFTLFHTNPSRLQFIVNGLAERLKAQDIE